MAGHASRADQGRRRRCACLLHCHRLWHTHPRGRLAYQIQQGRHHCHRQWTQRGQSYCFYLPVLLSDSIIQQMSLQIKVWSLFISEVWSVKIDMVCVNVIFRCVNLMGGTTSWKKPSRVTLRWSKLGKLTKLAMSSSGTSFYFFLWLFSPTSDRLEVVFLNRTVSHVRCVLGVLPKPENSYFLSPYCFHLAQSHRLFHWREGHMRRFLKKET